MHSQVCSGGRGLGSRGQRQLQGRRPTGMQALVLLAAAHGKHERMQGLRLLLAARGSTNEEEMLGEERAEEGGCGWI